MTACCDWETFQSGFIHHWKKQRHSPGELLIDWKRAKRDWKRYSMTGFEAAYMQLSELSGDQPYGFLPPWYGGDSGNDPGPGNLPIKPKGLAA